ncbi:MAG: hypothetical protein AAB222_05740, partial [Candidatus Binatota bacterium]
MPCELTLRNMMKVINGARQKAVGNGSKIRFSVSSTGGEEQTLLSGGLSTSGISACIFLISALRLL